MASHNPTFTTRKVRIISNLDYSAFSDGSGLNLYDYGSRMQDPQIGRWWVLDPKAELLEMSSPYVYSLNSPIIYIDPDGELPILINGCRFRTILYR